MGKSTNPIYWVVQIASINLTEKLKNATRTGCMEEVRPSNE